MSDLGNAKSPKLEIDKINWRKMKVSDYVAARLAFLNLDTCFAVTGGGAMHLNDAFGENASIDCRYLHHEQAAAMAAEGYARIAGKPAILNVTTGPGALNAFNGIFGAYTDSIPMLILAGQVRLDTISNIESETGIRQLGDQEVRSMNMVKEITKARFLVKYPEEIVGVIDTAYFEAVNGRPGPVWVEIPVNIQGSLVDADPMANVILPKSDPIEIQSEVLASVIDRLSKASRPVIISGSGVRLSGTEGQVLELAELLEVPIATAWTHDTINSDHELYAGRPGTIGTRPGNFVVQNADLLLVLGSRLNIRQVSYNWDSFAKDAEIIWIDIDPIEFNKSYMQRSAITKIESDLKKFIPALVNLAKSNPVEHKNWIEWCAGVREKYQLRESEYISTNEGINAYHLIPEIFKLIDNETSVVCGNATACIVPFQTAYIKQGMRLFSNSGSASMGYDLPAALGAAVANPSRRVVCLAGDGSIMMNLQELETLKAWNVDVLVVILDNDGYLSIKQTQQNFFGHDHGASPKSGVTFPDFTQVAKAFGLDAHVLDPAGNWKAQLREIVLAKGPRLVVAPLEISQEFIPRLKSKMVNGKIETPELDDMFPHIDENELAELRKSAQNVH